jgi:hypothetical protein
MITLTKLIEPTANEGYALSKSTTDSFRSELAQLHGVLANGAARCTGLGLAPGFREVDPPRPGAGSRPIAAAAPVATGAVS